MKPLGGGESSCYLRGSCSYGLCYQGGLFLLPFFSCIYNLYLCTRFSMTPVFTNGVQLRFLILKRKAHLFVFQYSLRSLLLESR
uniref:Uncharacterized protein n=1 Tax=Arundo donax TaxID=35708 RepID=A0A0A9B8G3_ARUDO